MKKILSLLLAIMMMLGTMSAIAETQSEVAEIKFRGIDWGVSYYEVMSKLSDWGIKWYTSKATSGRRIKSLINDAWSDYYDYDCAYYTYSSSSSPTKQVAGYDIDNVKLYFAFVPNSSGKLTQSPDDTSFYFAQYKIKPTDVEAVYGDLKVKLSSLYGEPAKEASDGWIIHYNYCYWYGANDTMVVIVTDDNYDCIYINYVWNHGETLMQTAENLLRQAEIDAEREKFGTDNTDGL